MRGQSVAQCCGRELLLLVLRDHIGQPTRSGEESSDGDVEEMFSPISHGKTVVGWGPRSSSSASPARRAVTNESCPKLDFG
jgi:hypothetical protein